MRHLLTAAAIAVFAGTAMADQPATTANSEAAGQTGEIFEVIEGNPDAKVEVIEYASYTCPHCAAFHEDQYQKLREEYIDTGLIKFTYREVYFDRPSLWASLLARCGGPMRYAGISDRLFDEQDTWTGAKDGQAIVNELREIGRFAGMNDEQIDACLTDSDQAKALVAWSEGNVETHKVKSTPTLVINGENHSNLSYEDLSEVLDDALSD